MPEGKRLFLSVLCGIDDGVSFAEEEGDAPKGGKTHQNVHDPAYHGGLTTENPCDDVKFEEAYRPPVDTADD